MADRYEVILERIDEPTGGITANQTIRYAVVDNDAGYVVCRCEVQPSWTGSAWSFGRYGKPAAEAIALLLNGTPYP